MKYIASDWLESPLKRRTRNDAGTIRGGSLYAAIDPFYALMVAKNLGREYVVWDRAAEIRHRRPGDTKLYATFVLGREEIEEIRDELRHRRSTDRVYTVELVDETGDVKTRIEKTIYVGWRDANRFDGDLEGQTELAHEKEAG